MAKLVAHEVQIAAIDGGSSNQTDHLVKSYAAIYYTVAVLLAEVPVHISIDEPENDGLVSHQCLVMAFCIRNSLFILTAVGHFPENAGRLPVLIFLLLDGLDPVIRHIHSQTVIEAIAAIFKLGSQAGHAADVFSYGDGTGLHFMDELVCQSQVADGIIILMTVEIISIAHEGFTQTVAVVKHRGYAVKAEAIEVEFF